MRYAAFISYSHQADIRRAQHLRQALHSFAKPWNSTRALRVFLDNAALSADPGLWSTVERALGDSEFLVLMASPQSARSPWVAKEISWWRQGPRARNLLLVVTGGELHWDDTARDFDWARTTCLPPELSGLFEEEPRWVDLSWMGEDHTGDLRDPRFRECVADLAAPLHKRPKDELIGEDVSQRRRFQRFRRGMLAAMTALAVLSTTAAVYAFVQRQTAQEQARIATARQLAATALNLSGDDLEVASLLALQAYQVQKTPETLSALYRLTTQSPHLVRFVRGDGRVTALAHTALPRYMAAGTDKGSVTIWTSDGARTAGRVSVSGEVTSLVFSNDGRLLAIGTSSGATVVHDLRTHHSRRLSAGTSEVYRLAFRPSSHDLAAIDGAGSLRLYGAEGSEPSLRIDTRLRAGAVNLAFWDKGSKLAVVTPTGWRLYDDRLRKLKSSDDVLYPGNGYVSAASPSGNCFGFIKFGGPSLESVTELVQDKPPGSDTGNGGCGAQPTLSGKEAASLAVSDGNRIAVGTSQGLAVGTAAKNDPAKTVLDLLPGVKAPSVLAFSPGEGDRLASADGNTIALWALGKAAPTMHRHHAKVPDGATVETQPALAVAPNGKVAWSQEPDLDSPSLHLWSPGHDLPGEGTDMTFDALAFTKNGNTLYAASDSAVETWTRKSGVLRRATVAHLPETSGAIGTTRIAPGSDGRAVVLRSDGSVLLLTPETGQVSTAVARTAPHRTENDRKNYGYTEYKTALSENGALAAVASEDGRVNIYELPSGHRVRQLDLGGSSLDSLTLSEGSQSLFAVTDGRVLQHWDVRTGTSRWRSDGAGQQSLTADPNGQWVATLSGDGTIWLWDARTGDRLASTVLPLPDFSWSGTGGTGTQSSIVFAPDGKRLWTITEGGEVLSWDTSVDAWIKTLCDRVGRRLTEPERTRYLTPVSNGYTACSQYPEHSSGTP
ncbi:WD40 repeat [Streptomyces sp. 2224.1]|uniref:toll/interleukin-1 receptor domain-containing protein n=1 Tax=unclassified Streptomyces TaxID=2593676 RepID=UPI000882C9B5|nr:MULTISPECIES: PQQ-binding-like beta-propeller repeat protein [unclassified Streptomyces]PBC81233.1 WD40 repeat protein [Streptomyces sp. 2321.6]SDR55902.1 WD40 repeat [Streptomyces sp. KS_16]SEC06679.1 WD40 repeat [Streptomyces sp. 2133.1]SED22613.1 WD40 repeat [Streptomyces sp. 2224.1]SEF09400.1 WD40 repeat [Streptomyces sp. 2112.3]